MSDSSSKSAPLIGSGVGLLGVWAGLICLELVSLSVIYKNLLHFECSSTGFFEFCLSISDTPIRAIAAFGVMVIFFMTRPETVYDLLRNRRPSLSWGWLMVHFAGLAVILAPLAYLNNDISTGGFYSILGVWIVGAVLASAGAIFTLFELSAVRELFRKAGTILVVALLAAFAAPEVTQLLQYAWKWQLVTDMTFNAVTSVLALGGISLTTVSATKEIGIGDFAVMVGDSCSGLEGVALIMIFVTLYIALFRDKLNIGRALLLYPIGIVASLSLNVVRIAVLILIGAYHSPDLAINGFHSHAGWFFFMLLSLTLAIVANSISWFRKTETAQVKVAGTRRMPFASDPNVAMILPFIVFMLSILILDTITQTPSLYYPLRVVAMIAVLVYCRRYIMELVWKIDPLAVGGGVLIAVLWLFAADNSAPEWQQALYALPAPVLAIWVICRVVGTTFLVPVIEELFFRGYILGRFVKQGPVMLAVGVALSTGLFAALHGKWVLAIIAGLIFAALYLRRERVADPIVAHVVANAIIAAAAVVAQNWALI